jgi:hypothetical protein
VTSDRLPLVLEFTFPLLFPSPLYPMPFPSPPSLFLFFPVFSLTVVREFSPWKLFCLQMLVGGF